ncbi:MAG: hemerythrin family protein [Rhodocyclaceae bacterium]|jgi:hemerythrin|nr:hemerythrin family protein [Rhodocyclaceae bacterium]
MPIFWRPQLKIGHPDIDADHRYLILLINTVELVLRFPEKPEHIQMALQELRHYAVTHFDREERIQIAWGYPHLDLHKVEHRNLMEALDALIARLDKLLTRPGADLSEISAQGQEITTFLRSWLVDHVLKADMHMAEMFKKPKLV